MWFFNNRKKTKEDVDKSELSDILSSYCLGTLNNTLTDLGGSDVWADIEKCDKKFRKSYFIEAQGLKQLQEEIKNLENTKTKLSNLQLNNTQNYKIISEKIQKAKEILKEQQQLETRIDFKNNVEGDKQYKFVSFDDFANILKSYGYSFDYTTINSWTGLISEKTINLLQHINYVGDNKGRNYIYAYRTQNSPMTSVVTCSYDSTNRVGIIRSYGYFMRGQRNLGKAVIDAWLGTDSLEYKVIDTIEDKKIYVIPTHTTKLRYHRLVNPEDITNNPIFPNTKKQVESLGTSIVFQVDEMDPKVPLIAVSENHKPLIFQTWCDGVIIYGFVENEHI